MDRYENLLATSMTPGTSQAFAVGRCGGRWSPVGLSQVRAFGRDTNRSAPFKILGKLVLTGPFSAHLMLARILSGQEAPGPPNRRDDLAYRLRERRPRPGSAYRPDHTHRTPFSEHVLGLNLSPERPTRPYASQPVHCPCLIAELTQPHQIP